MSVNNPDLVGVPNILGMPKSKQQKQQTVATLEEGLKQAKAVVFANFQGLTVAETEELRRNCRQENISVLAAKKTLVKRALDNMGLTEASPKVFQGGIATFMAKTDEVAAARIVNAFAKKHEFMTIFGGILEGKFIDTAMVKSLAALPGKQELLAKLVGSLNAPIAGFANVCAGTMRSLLNVLNNIQKAKV